MPGFLEELKSLYRVQLERHRNRPFLRGVMAAAALVASIHGQVTLGQRMRLDKVLETLNELKVFDPHEGVDLFDEYVQAILEDPPKGQTRALRDVKEVAAEDGEKAELLIRICLAISEADGGIDLAEQIEIVTLCSILGVDPSNHALYTDDPAGGVIARINREAAAAADVANGHASS
ncbi:MAG: TerB family tellurite resistance protein [Gammaproteobacteria bacterium]|nr:TerB family tellurite resistance protein [Gammaproteobacteria bacterium]